MKQIDKSKIDNSRIPDAVMVQVIPLLNEAAGEIARLRGEVAELSRKVVALESTKVQVGTPATFDLNTTAPQRTVAGPGRSRKKVTASAGDAAKQG